MKPDKEPYAARAARDLEWSRLLEHLASFALGALPAARLRALAPASELAEARLFADRSRSAVALAGDDKPIPTVALADISPVLDRASHRGMLDGEELLAVSRVLAHASRLRQFAAQLALEHAALCDVLGSDPALDELQAELAASLTDDGDVADAASPALAAARRAVESLRRDLSRQMRQLVARYSAQLSQAFSTERDGRPVLPVRSDSASQVPGLVLGSSASGATLFVEPREISDLANRLQYAVASVERERQRVLRLLSDRVADVADAVSQAHEACVAADMLRALSRWAAAAQATVFEPGSEPRAVLGQARHPLLLIQGVDVVPNDIALSSGRALVISGPNAGGKTVALKCLGLAAWMVRAGIPIPADPTSEIGFFRDVLTDMADEQSLSMNLSTFSAHLTTLGAFCSRAAAGVLVLLDEVCVGTDPEEGAALAVATVEALVAQGAAVGVTTHYERLKEHAAEDSRFDNASVGLQVDTFLPTFRLELGVPGPSSALLAARRFGIDAQIVARAEQLMPEQALRRESLLQELAAALSRAAEREQSLSQELLRQRELRLELEGQRESVREQERRRLVREGEQLAAEVRSARAELRRVMQSLRHAPGQSDSKRADRALDKALHPVAIGGRLASLRQTAPLQATPGLAVPPALEVGGIAYLAKLGVSVEIAALEPNGDAVVLAGTMKLRVRAAELEGRRGGAPRAKAKPKPKPRPTSRTQDGFLPVRAEDNTVDLRGMRVEEGLDLLERFVDGLLERGERAGYVLHGHGSGAMKAAVRQRLPSLSLIGRVEPASREDGGDAFTIFYFD
ncbi:MAG: Smr/MutS family protein [Polyangiaceae bacterium]